MPRPKLGRVTLHTNVSPETLKTLKDIANSLGLTHTTNKGQQTASTGKLLDMIAEDLYVLSKLRVLGRFPVDTSDDIE